MNRDLHLLYGGTFDPVHAGHVAVAHAVQTAAQPDRLWFVPSARPPHRAAPHVSAAQRVQMLTLMLADQQGKSATANTWGVDRCEVQRAERGLASYTVDTLREKRALDPASRFLWVLGWDALLGLPTWKEPEVLRSLTSLIVLPRAGADLPADHPLHAAWQARKVLTPHTARSAQNGSLLFCAMPEHPASATTIRNALRGGERVTELLSPSVAEYIEHEKLYRDATSVPGGIEQD